MKLFRKSLSVVLAALMLLTVFSVAAFAADTDVTVFLRVEGIKKNLFYNNVTVSDGATVADVLNAAAAADESFTVVIGTGDYGLFLTEINGEVNGSMTEKGWDGWQYRINGVGGMGVGYDTVKDGDSILFYYADEWGDNGFAYPQIDVSALNDKGELTFTVTEGSYAEDGTYTETEAALTGYTLYWDGKAVTPDENGVAKISAAGMKKGDHSVQIEKTAKNGLPLVLRFAPDYTVKTEMSFFARVGLFFSRLIETVRGFFANLTKK